MLALGWADPCTISPAVVVCCVSGAAERCPSACEQNGSSGVHIPLQPHFILQLISSE